MNGSSRHRSLVARVGGPALSVFALVSAGCYPKPLRSNSPVAGDGVHVELLGADCASAAGSASPSPRGLRPLALEIRVENAGAQPLTFVPAAARLSAPDGSGGEVAPIEPGGTFTVGAGESRTLVLRYDNLDRCGAPLRVRWNGAFARSDAAVPVSDLDLQPY